MIVIGPGYQVQYSITGERWADLGRYLRTLDMARAELANLQSVGAIPPSSRMVRIARVTWYGQSRTDVAVQS